jgi:hypothetical protein
MQRAINTKLAAYAMVTGLLTACERQEPGEASGVLPGATHTQSLQADQDRCERSRGRAPHLRDTVSNLAGAHEGWAIDFQGDADVLQAHWSGRARNLDDRNPHRYNLNLDMDFVMVMRGELIRFYPAFGEADHIPFTVDFDYDYALSRQRVTVGAWRQCEQACICNIRSQDGASDDEPMLGVSWHDARVFTYWANLNDTQDYAFRLPSESEWLRAAAVYPDLIDEGALEWLGDCFHRPLDDTPRNGEALARIPDCSTKLVMRHDPDAMDRHPGRGGRVNGSRTTPHPDTGFRLARRFDLTALDASGQAEQPDAEN